MGKIYSNIKERVLYLADLEEDSKQIFFKKVGLKYSNFTGKSKESDLSSKGVAEILLIYPKINPNWLLNGKGRIYISDLENQVNDPAAIYSSEDTVLIKLFTEALQAPTVKNILEKIIDARIQQKTK